MYFAMLSTFSLTIDITFNDIWIEEISSFFDLIGVIHIDDLSHHIRECISIHKRNIIFSSERFLLLLVYILSFQILYKQVMIKMMLLFINVLFLIDKHLKMNERYIQKSKE